MSEYKINPYLSGTEMISRERRRQIIKEGYNAEHDERLEPGALAMAAAVYIMGACSGMRGGGERPGEVMICWPFEISAYNPKDPLRDLVRAGALIAAEIDRMMRVEGDEIMGGETPPLRGEE